ncbi:MAG: sigma-70 family RNA polymerase sigma factor [Ignavibacteria bacterium]
MEVNLDIVKRIQNGESQLFAEIANAYKDKAFSLTMKILKNREEAEDSLQDAFMKLYKAIINGNYEAKSKFSTYFYSIVYNSAIDLYRKYNVRSFNITSIEINDSNYNEGDELSFNFETKIDKNQVNTAEYSTDKRVTESEIKNIINQYINAIPEQYSVILNMFFLNDLSHEEISVILKIPVGTVKNRIFRAKEKMKELLFRHFNKEELLEYIKV